MEAYLEKLNSNLIFKSKWFFGLVFGFCILIIVFAHIYNIDKLPAGLYIDETSIGINAAAISQNGEDEYQTKWPLYFKAFGEYKNPVYIYVTALFFKIFGISIWTLRFSSSFFYFMGLVPLILLFFRLSKSKIDIVILTLMSGFLPQYFIMSRVSFEVISHFTLISWIIYLVYLTFENRFNFSTIDKISTQDQNSSSKFRVLDSITNNKNIFQQFIFSNYILPILLGVSIGLSVYTYTTARVLSFLLIISLGLFYSKKPDRTKLFLVIFSFLITILPYLNFFYFSGDSLTGRFNQISYLSRPEFSWLQKLLIFLGLYFNYFINLDFLILRGDSNLRHGIGSTGLLLIITFTLGYLGIFYLIKNQLQQIKTETQKLNLIEKLKTVTGRDKAFSNFVLLNLLFSPVAASLTLESWPHMLRNSLLGIYFLVLSVFGLKNFKPVFKYLIFGFLLLEIIHFNVQYFYFYPPISVQAFASSGFNEAVNYAYKQNPQVVIVSKESHQAYVNFEFAKYSVSNPKNIPIQIDEIKIYPNSCLIFLENEQNSVNKLENSSLVETNYQLGYTKVRCWK